MAYYIANVTCFIASVENEEHTNREGGVHRRDGEYRFWDKGRSIIFHRFVRHREMVASTGA